MQPLRKETELLFTCVSNHDFDTLAQLCDDDFGIIDLDTNGKNVLIHDRAGWENWFHSLFARLTEMDAKTYTEIRNYEVLAHDTMAYSVVQFDQFLEVNQQKLKFFCTATIIWKNTPNGWKESRWHVSLIDGPVVV
jgi:hypothetical protein